VLFSDTFPSFYSLTINSKLNRCRDWAGDLATKELQFNAWQGQKILVLSIVSRLALGPTASYYSLVAKWLRCEVDHLFPCNADRMHGAVPLL
jgi:hypothetical protein